MITIHIEPVQEAKQASRLVQSAVRAEIAKLELAVEMARKRLGPFEQKYGVTSDRFAAAMTAEDLDGGDDEYVCWAGEYKLLQRLQAKLTQLKAIRYVD